jgi:hypothetical protein
MRPSTHNSAEILTCLRSRAYGNDHFQLGGKQSTWPYNRLVVEVHRRLVHKRSFAQRTGPPKAMRAESTSINYSLRSACIGFTDAARRAGK